MPSILLHFPPPPRFLPIITRSEGYFTTRIYHYPHRRPGSQYGWSVYWGNGRIGYGLRATEPAAEAAAKRSKEAVRREGVKYPGRQRAHSNPHGVAPKPRDWPWWLFYDHTHSDQGRRRPKKYIRTRGRSAR